VTETSLEVACSQSVVLPTVEQRLIGLYDDASVLEPFPLYIGITIAFFHAVGKTP
jgi:hypothetical protein